MSGASFLRALELAAFPASGVVSVSLNGWRVLIANVGGDYLALNDRCTHAASPLSTGRLRHGAIMCPLHGARFELATGKCIGSAHRPVRSFPARITDGWIEVCVPDEPPGLSEAPIEI